MENTEKYPVSAVDIQQEPKKEREFNLTPSESVFLSQLEKSLKNHAADMTAPPNRWKCFITASVV